MKNITVEDIVNITGGTLIYGNKNEECENFIRDTRNIEEGDIFIGLKGEKIDGGSFYKEALENGAKGCIINKDAVKKIEKITGKFVIEVEDTVLAVQKIAKFKREKYNIPVVAVTGSVGKTSTKDIIASVVSEKYNVLKTQGNRNNHIGLPMTILGLKDHDAMVVEMGMNHLGEISTLSHIAEPTIAVITNVGTAHIGNLGSRENILKAKLEILEGLKENGKLVINNDNDLLNKWYIEKADKNKVVTYGITEKSMENAKNIVYLESGSKYVLKDAEDETEVKVPIGGEAFVYNSLAAICVGKILGIDIEKIKNGIKKFELTQMRLDIKKTEKGYTVINDCYNANYDSMKSAIECLKSTEGNRKIAVLGDMLELGEYSKELHEKVGEDIVKNNINVLVTVGEEAKAIAKIAKHANIETFEYDENNKAIEKLKDILQPGDVVLIKASNSMKFIEIVQEIM